MSRPKAKYLKAPLGWTPDSRNPFSADGSYGPSWTGLALVEGGTSFIGTSKSGLFHYRCGRADPNVEAVMADFLRYENEHGRTPILFLPADMDIDAFVSHALGMTPPPHVVRDTDPEYLVHSTSLAAGELILRDGEIKSLARLSRERTSPAGTICVLTPSGSHRTMHATLVSAGSIALGSRACRPRTQPDDS